jgi:hypothetical protein
MKDKKNTQDVLEEHGKRRREFVVKSAKVAVIAPAVSLLLSEAATAVDDGMMSGGINEEPYYNTHDDT